MSYRKHLMASDEPPSELYKAVELGTNLAEVGTDCISRQAAIDALKKQREELLKGLDKNSNVYGIISASTGIVICTVGQLPSAQPERKKGKWIEYEQEFKLEEPLKTVQKTVRECSVCTAKIAGMVGIMNYCPNCGADMRGEHDV